MIIHDYHEVIDALKEAYERQSLGMGVALILDLEQSLVAEDVVYAYRQCCMCGYITLVTLGEEPPKKCPCGYRYLRGYTADIVIQGVVVLYNHNRDRSGR